MYNNYRSPNHDMMFQNAIPSVDSNHPYFLNYVPSVDPNYQTFMPENREERVTDIDLYPETAVQTIPLGHGFFSYRWQRVIGGNDTLRAFINVPQQNVISGGWAPSGFAPLSVLESFPHQHNQWVITVSNQGGRRNIGFWVIAKTP